MRSSDFEFNQPHHLRGKVLYKEREREKQMRKAESGVEKYGSRNVVARVRSQMKEQ